MANPQCQSDASSTNKAVRFSRRPSKRNRAAYSLLRRPRKSRSSAWKKHLASVSSFVDSGYSMLIRHIHSHGQSNSPFLNWSSLQPLLETAIPHVLIILDCCFAATAVRDTTEGTTKEILAACGRESPNLVSANDLSHRL